MPKSKPSPPERNHFDGPWKAALFNYFWEFLELCFPALYNEFDRAPAGVSGL